MSGLGIICLASPGKQSLISPAGDTGRVFAKGALPSDPTAESLRPGQLCAGKKCEPLFHLYEFPIAAVTKDHKPGGFKEHRFVILQSRRPEAGTTFPWAETRAR